ncbi:MAG: transcriptional repressor [Bacteroidales bacterium]|nr:transcriptional repressor [Bacteroidales bacterium]
MLMTVRKIFTDYLQQHNLRKTPERFAILQEIYSTNGHFDIEELYNKMKDNKYRVSRATLYNTIDLLLDCNLVIKHQFGHNCAQYERSYKFRQHDHFVDLETGQVLEYCDPRLMEIQKTIEDALGVEITQHSLVFYGHKKK